MFTGPEPLSTVTVSMPRAVAVGRDEYKHSGSLNISYTPNHLFKFAERLFRDKLREKGKT